jgi:putative nucleotidyltransferase with HDIG domain
MSVEVKTLQIDRAVFQQTLEKKLADLPPLPAIVTRIMQTVNNPNTSADELNQLISLDQGLASKLLRIVNSAYYGFPKRISTITHAVVILGFNTVRNLVLGVSAFGMLSKKAEGQGLDRLQFWEHSIAVAVCSSLLAKKKKPKTRSIVEEAFITGLLHDIGQLFLDCYFPVQYAVTLVYAERQNISLLEAEKKVLGIDHTIVGKKIAEQWNFPPSLTACIGLHHHPIPGSDHFEASALVHAADWIAWQMQKRVGKTDNSPEMDAAVAEWLGLGEEDFQQLMVEVESQFGAACEMMKLANAA